MERRISVILLTLCLLAGMRSRKARTFGALCGHCGLCALQKGGDVGMGAE